MLKAIHKIKKQKVFKFIPVVSGLTLLGVLGCASSAYASTVDLPLNIQVQDAGITVSLSDPSVDISLNPANGADGLSDYNTGTVNVTVTAQGGNGYKLVMYGDTTLTSGDTTSTLAPTANTATLSSSNFTMNSWGYNVGGTAEGAFKAFTGYDEIKSSSNATETTKINFGAKININQPASTYSNTLHFAAVAKMNATIMQDSDIATRCATTAGDNDPITVYDLRDNNYYEIKQLADGKCWMLDNLALDLTDDNVKAGLNSLNTNASNTTLSVLKSGIYNETTNPTGVKGVDNASGKYAVAGVSSTWVKNIVNWENDKYVDHSQDADWESKKDQYTDNWSSPRISIAGTFNGNTYTKDSTINSTFNDGTIVNNKKIGVYYNYCAASAGSYCYVYDDAGTDNASEDICPASWRLPTGGGSGGFKALYVAEDSEANVSASTFNANMVTALQLPLSGSFNSGSTTYQGSYGYWWTSTQYSSYGMYYLFISKSTVDPAYNVYRTGRYSGFSIRCVLDTSSGI